MTGLDLVRLMEVPVSPSPRLGARELAWRLLEHAIAQVERALDRPSARGRWRVRVVDITHEVAQAVVLRYARAGWQIRVAEAVSTEDGKAFTFELLPPLPSPP